MTVGPAFFAPQGGSGPVFVSSAVDSLGTVSAGDLVLLFLLVAGGSAPSAPTGWTQIFSGSSNLGYAVAIYSSHYAGGNAAANTTNFPPVNGYFDTLVYAGNCTVPQVGSLASQGNVSDIVAPALGSATGGNSALVAWGSSRDAGSISVTSGGSMTERLQATHTYFTSSLHDAAGVQSGSRTLHRASVSNSFEFNGILLEVQAP